MTERNLDEMGVIALILGAVGIILNYAAMFLVLAKILVAETAAATECRLVAPFFLPAFATIGIAGGVMWLVASVGWFQKQEWAYTVSIIAVVINLFANFWPNIPAMESKAASPGPWFLLFIPNILVFFYVARKKGEESWAKSILGLLIGMGFILCFINGIASTTRTINRLPAVTGLDDQFSAALMYMLCLPNNMLASVIFGYAVIGLFLSKKKNLVRTMAIGGAFLGMAAGYPLALWSSFTGVAAGFSMFTLGPIVSTVIALIVVPSNVWEKISA